MDNRRSPCPPGQHPHPGIIGCHSITQRHRSLGGSTGDPRLDTKMDIEPTFMRNKKTEPSKLLTGDEELYNGRGEDRAINEAYERLVS